VFSLKTIPSETNNLTFEPMIEWGENKKDLVEILITGKYLDIDKIFDNVCGHEDIKMDDVIMFIALLMDAVYTSINIINEDVLKKHLILCSDRLTSEILLFHHRISLDELENYGLEVCRGADKDNAKTRKFISEFFLWGFKNKKFIKGFKDTGDIEKEFLNLLFYAIRDLFDSSTFKDCFLLLIREENLLKNLVEQCAINFKYNSNGEIFVVLDSYLKEGKSLNLFRDNSFCLNIVKSICSKTSYYSHLEKRTNILYLIWYVNHRETCIYYQDIVTWCLKNKYDRRNWALILSICEKFKLSWDSKADNHKKRKAVTKLDNCIDCIRD
jgi:hypothetical protein